MNNNRPGNQQNPLGNPLGNRGDQEAQLQALIGQQLATISTNLFCRVAAEKMAMPGPPSVDYRSLARLCHRAAKHYLEGLSITKFNDEDDHN